MRHFWVCTIILFASAISMAASQKSHGGSLWNSPNNSGVSGTWMVEPSFGYFNETLEPGQYSHDHYVAGVHVGYRYNDMFSAGLLYDYLNGATYKVAYTDTGLAIVLGGYYERFGAQFMYYIMKDHTEPSNNLSEGSAYKLTLNYYAPLFDSFYIVPKIVLIKHIEYKRQNSSSINWNQNQTQILEWGFAYLF